MPVDYRPPKTKSEVRRSVFWGVALPLMIMALALFAHSQQRSRTQDPAQLAYLKTGIQPPR